MGGGGIVSLYIDLFPPALTVTVTVTPPPPRVPLLSVGRESLHGRRVCTEGKPHHNMIAHPGPLRRSNVPIRVHCRTGDPAAMQILREAGKGESDRHLQNA